MSGLKCRYPCKKSAVGRRITVRTSCKHVEEKLNRGVALSGMCILVNPAHRNQKDSPNLPHNHNSPAYCFCQACLSMAQTQTVLLFPLFSPTSLPACHADPSVSHPLMCSNHGHGMISAASSVTITCNAAFDKGSIRRQSVCQISMIPDMAQSLHSFQIPIYLNRVQQAHFGDVWFGNRHRRVIKKVGDNSHNVSFHLTMKICLNIPVIIYPW